MTPPLSTIQCPRWGDENMFLTKMPINPRRRGARNLLASPQALHAAVMAGFPDARRLSLSGGVTQLLVATRV